MNDFIKNKKEVFKKGFTLIELLVVIAVIGVLATIVLASLGAARDSAREKRFVAQVTSLQKAAELIYAVEGNYPGRFDYYPNNPDPDADIANFHTQFADYINTDKFLDSIPNSIQAFTFISEYTTSGDVNSSAACPSQNQSGLGQTYAIIFSTVNDASIPDTEEFIVSNWHTATFGAFHVYCVASE